MVDIIARRFLKHSGTVIGPTKKVPQQTEYMLLNYTTVVPNLGCLEYGLQV